MGESENGKHSNFLESINTPLDSMSESDLREELESWRIIWTWLDPEVQYWLTHVGQLFRVSLRNGQTFFGTLGACKYSPTQLVLKVSDRQYDWASEIAIYETKDVAVKVTDVVGYQFIYDREEQHEPHTVGQGPAKTEDEEILSELEGR